MTTAVADTKVSDADRQLAQRGEDEVAAVIAEKWRCRPRETPMYHYYDLDLDRGNELVAIVEIKTRRCESTTYEEVWLTLEKWYRLIDISRSLGVAAILVYNFADEARYIEVGKIDARRHEVTGRTDRPEMRHDISTKILIPVAQMETLCKW